MLSPSQIDQFNRDGYLVVEDVFSQQNRLDPVRAEYQALLSELISDWVIRKMPRRISPRTLSGWVTA